MGNICNYISCDNNRVRIDLDGKPIQIRASQVKILGPQTNTEIRSCNASSTRSATDNVSNYRETPVKSKPLRSNSWKTDYETHGQLGDLES